MWYNLSPEKILSNPGLNICSFIENNLISLTA